MDFRQVVSLQINYIFLSTHTHGIKKHAQSIHVYKTVIFCIRQYFTFSRKKSVLSTFHTSLLLSPTSFLKSVFNTYFQRTILSPTIFDRENQITLTIVALILEKQHWELLILLFYRHLSNQQ